MPIYNSETYLEESIGSILSQKGNFEVELIICDGGSKDNTCNILQKYYYKNLIGEIEYGFKKLELIIVSENDEGMYDALRKGFMMSTGEILCWLNGDDVYFEGAFQKVVDIFTELENVDWISGRTNVFENGSFICKSLIRSYPSQYIKNGLFGLYSGCFIPQENTFWRKKIIENIDLEEFASYKSAGDFYLWSKMAESATLYSVNEDFAAFRKHGSNKSADKVLYRSEMEKIISNSKKYSERQLVWLRNICKDWNGRCISKIPFNYIDYVCGKYEVINNRKKRMVDEKPLLSIITICKNCGTDILCTLESIAHQTFKNFEWIIIDGDSTDGTKEILLNYSSSYDVYVSEKDYGIYDAMNKGVKLAHGEWILFMNGGDQFYDFDVLEHVFEKDISDKVDVLYGDEERYIGGETHIYKLPEKIPKYFLCAQSFAHQSMLYRRRLFEIYGNYDISYKMSGDSEYNDRLLNAGVKFKKISIIISSRTLDGVSDNPEMKRLSECEKRGRRLKYHTAKEIELYENGVKESIISIRIPIIKIKKFRDGVVQKYYLFGVIPLITARRAY